jgi:hypothetical protein
VLTGSGDFNGDGRSDLLFRSTAGGMIEWLGQADGSFAWNPAAVYSLSTDWDVAAIADVNGDGHDDLVLRNHNGVVTEWLGVGGGTFFSNHDVAFYALPSTWSVAGSGDYNGDGRGDIILRDAQGTVIEWLGQPSGAFAFNGAATVSLDQSWHIF